MTAKFLVTHTMLLAALLPTAAVAAAPPVPTDDQVLTAEGAAVTFDVRANDSDPDGDALTVSSTTLPSSGGVVINPDGSLTYTPNAGFTGDDAFTYTLSDGSSSAIGEVDISVNATFDAELARDQILLGVTALVNPTQPGHMVVYGPTAYSISNYPGGDLSDPMIAAGTIGAGRVVAAPDHQWLNMGSYGGDPSMAAYYQNSIAWLADSTSTSISIVTYDDTASASWLTSQGYTNVTNATSATLATALATADVLAAAWIGSSPPAGLLQTIDAFIVAGGGLFIADYGVGYDWWWGQDTIDIPGNRLLRKAGIAFTKEWPHGSSSQTINRAVGQVDYDDLLALVNDWSMATNAEKEEGAAILTKLSDVLRPEHLWGAMLLEEVLGSTAAYIPTPTTPVTDSFAKALLVWESNYLIGLPVSEVTAHPSALPVGALEPRITTTRTLNAPDGHATIRIPTGLYAAPGEIVTVTLPAGFATLGLRARISHLRTDLGDSSYFHMPFQQIYFDLDAANVDIASPYGGLISIEAESGEDGIQNATFTFANVVEAPYYVHGVTTDADWVAGIRDRQTPFGVLVTAKSIHVIEAEGHLRTLSDPVAVMQIWEEMIHYIEEFYSYTTYRPLRVHHDYQPVGGFSTFPQSYSVTRVMLDYLELLNYGHGLTIHEYGHIVDPSEMIFQNFSEASPNFGGIYASRFHVPFTYRPKESQERLNRYVRSQSVDLWSLAPHSYHHEKITPFICLADAFGWDHLINVIAALRLTNPANNQDKVDNWLTLYGSEVGHDISPFFALWQLSPTASALAAVSGLPSWNMVEQVEDRLVLHQNTAITFPSPVDNDFSYDGGLTLTSTTNPTSGTLTQTASGYRYAPNPGFVGSDSFDYTVTNATGNTFTATVPITVLDPANSPKIVVGSTTAAIGSWQLVQLPHSYTSAVIVAQHVESAGAPPIVTRVRVVTPDSFEVSLQRADGGSGTGQPLDVHYIVCEEGSYSEAAHGIKMEAVRRLSTSTDRTGSIVGDFFEAQWNTLDHYAQPLFLGQVMSDNDTEWSSWWSAARSQDIRAGKHVGSDSNIMRADETLGYLAFESGTMQFGSTYLRFGDTSDEFQTSVGSGGSTFAFPREPELTSAFAQGTGLEQGENPYLSVLTSATNLSANTIGVALRSDAGLSISSDRVGYLVAAEIEQGIQFIRGDANADASLNIADPVATLGFLFTSGSVPCEAALDSNADGTVNIGDPVYSLAYLFQPGSPEPLAPFPSCGSAAGLIPCAGFPACP